MILFHVLQQQGKQQGGFSLSGMKKALFGEDTQEQRDLKIKHLDEQIKITEMELKQINEEYRYTRVVQESRRLFK